MKRTYQVISADGHVETPPDPWVKYVPAKYRDRAPRLVKLDEGGEGWVLEGMPLLHIGQTLTAGAPVVVFRNGSYFNPDGTPVPGAGPAPQRLKEQDQDGVDAEVLFPPLMVSRFLEGITERPVYLAMVQAYNTWLAQEFCAVAPDRLIGAGVIPISGIDHAVLELKRCKELGLKSVSLIQFPNGTGGPKPEDDRFWETALSIGMPLSPHAGMGDPRPPPVNLAHGTASQTPAGALLTGAIGDPLYPISQMLVAGVFDRFPELKIYFAETNASWMPGALWFFDQNYRRFKDSFGLELKKLPTEYIRQHFYFSFIGDPMAMRLREHLPVDNLMWGSDHPHSVCTFPRSREWLATIFEGVPAEIKRKVLVETPANFFGLDTEKPLTPTPIAVAV